ncbi:MAG: D-alanyl-lipoteichoic acid biosynthesis protein DltB, partial [Gemmatimonadetes bacterium]|nr:D-alanyl-lipoteichoic acid biosynthesis protein DltB [Gemmatimonadota bacterium]
MMPYGSFFYFGLLFYIAVGVVVASLLGVRTRRIIFTTTVLMLVVQYGLTDHGIAPAPLRTIGRVLGFAAMQWLVAALFLRLRTVRVSRTAFNLAMTLALLPLLLEKFASDGAARLVAFVGISYTTFRALDVVICIQDGLIKKLPPAEYFSYLVFFPSISAGPIDRYRRFRGEYEQARTRAQLLIDFDAAVERVFRGVLYSFVIAPLINHYWLTRALARSGPVALVSYMYAYSFHLFFDFAGYSAFAIGVAYMLGVRMPENFNRPFLARNIVDFWNRWHISLSSWLRDHVYGRFVLSATKGRWFRDRYVAGYLGSILAFGLMGLWHGTAAHYLVYGLYHALLNVGYAMMRRSDRPAMVPLHPMVARALTFHLVCFGFLIFS